MSANKETLINWLKANGVEGLDPVKLRGPDYAEMNYLTGDEVLALFEKYMEQNKC